MNDALVANKWYPYYKGPLKLYNTPYPTPQSILRASVGSIEYSFVSETVTPGHIRAAVVMPRDVPIQHLLSQMPWSMIYTTPTWRMIIVSVTDVMTWIELARASGAVAWLKTHAQTHTYNWEPPERDETGNKIRPPNAMGMTQTLDGKRCYKKRYDRDEVLSDLKCGRYSTVEIGVRHGITSATVQSIAKQERIALTIGRRRDHRVKA